MDKKTEKKVFDKLELMIKLLSMSLANSLGPEATMTERARILKIAGLDNATIAEVLNTTRQSISVLTANIRRRKSR